MCSPARYSDEVRFLLGADLGLLAAQAAFGLGDLHAFAGAHPDQIGLELGDHRQDVEQQPADRVVHRAAEVELDGTPGELVGDRARVRKRSGESVELRHDERVAGPARGEGLTQTRTLAVGAGQAVVDVDALRGYAERLQAVALGGEVLLVGGDAGVADVQPGVRRSMPYGPPSPRHVTEPGLRDAGVPSLLGVGVRRRGAVVRR